MKERGDKKKTAAELTPREIFDEVLARGLELEEFGDDHGRMIVGDRTKRPKEKKEEKKSK